MIVRRVAGVEFLIQPLQGAGPLPIGHFPGIGQVIIGPVRGQPLGSQPVHVHKSEVALFLAVFELIDGEAVPAVVQKSPLPLLLVVQPFHNGLMEVGAGLPLLAGDGKNGGRRIFQQFLSVKDHGGILPELHHVNGQIPFQQLHRPVLGEREKIAVYVVAVHRQGISGNIRVRHGVLIQRGVRPFHRFRQNIRRRFLARFLPRLGIFRRFSRDLRRSLLRLGGRRCGDLRFRRSLFLLRGREVDAPFFANLPKVAVDAGNEGVGGLGDGVQAGLQFRQLPPAAPGGDVAEAVLSSLNAIILADGVGYALRLHLLGVAVLGLDLLRLFGSGSGGKALFLPVVQERVGDLMDGGADGLHLAHALPYGDGLIGVTAKSVRPRLQRRENNGHGGCPPQGLHENLIVLNIPGQRAGQLGKGLAIGLGHVEHLHRAEHGNFNFPLLHDDAAVLVQHGGLCHRVQLLFLDFLLKGRGGQDGDALLALLHMALKFVLPGVETGHSGCVRPLHIDEDGISGRIAVKSGHGAQIGGVPVALEQFFDAPLNSSGDLVQLLPVGGLFVCHIALLSAYWRRKSKAGFRGQEGNHTDTFKSAPQTSRKHGVFTAYFFYAGPCFLPPISACSAAPGWRHRMDSIGRFLPPL